LWSNLLEGDVPDDDEVIINSSDEIIEWVDVDDGEEEEEEEEEEEDDDDDDDEEVNDDDEEVNDDDDSLTCAIWLYFLLRWLIILILSLSSFIVVNYIIQVNKWNESNEWKLWNN